MPQISVIVPVYKVEPYLRICVDSILAQTFTDFELILVDDGSPDNCGMICDEYAAIDVRVQVIHKANGGLGNARNAGIDAAKGKYIIFLDSDDFWELNTLECLYTEAEKKRLDILFFSAEPFGDENINPEITAYYSRKVRNGIILNGTESLRIALTNNNYCASACLRLYLLEYIRKYNFRFDEGIIHEDESFSFLTYLYADRVETIGERFYKRRYRANSIMTSKSLCSSAHGYSIALLRLLDVYLHEHLDQKKKELFIQQITIYMNSIYFLFRETVQTGIESRSLKQAALLSKDVHPILKQARIMKPFLPKRLLLSTYSLFAGYLLTAVIQKISGHKFNSFLV